MALLPKFDMTKFLLTYGFKILTVLIILGALWFFITNDISVVKEPVQQCGVCVCP